MASSTGGAAALQAPIVTNPVPPAARIADVVAPSRVELASHRDFLSRALRNACADTAGLEATLQRLASSPAHASAALADAAVLEAHRRRRCADTPVPWTSLPPGAVGEAAAKEFGEYVSPAQGFARQPATPLPCDERAPGAPGTGLANFAVAQNGVLAMGNTATPQPMAPGMGPGVAPSGTVPVQMNLDPVSTAVGGPMQTVWTTRQPTEVRPLEERVAEANGAAQLSYQAWMSFGSALWPGQAQP